VVEKIKGVLNQIRPSKFSTIVSNNGSNVRNAHDIIEKKYPNIENVWYILHCINLYLSDMVQHRFAKKLLKIINILVSFFWNTAMASKNLI